VDKKSFVAPYLPATTEFEYKGPDIISEYRRGWLVGSPFDGIKDVVSPIVALGSVVTVLLSWLVFYQVPSRI
jgi:hypothetical protein